MAAKKKKKHRHWGNVRAHERRVNPPEPAKRLWNFFDGEPYLDNPRLFIVNPERKRRKKNMARRRRSMHSRRRRSYRRSRRSFRQNAFVPLAANPRRRRRTFRANPIRRGRRRSFRSNPFGGSSGTILGFPIKQVMLAGGAVVIAPWLERQVLSFMPVSFSSTSAGRWAGKIGAAAATGYLAKLAMGNEAARLAYIVLGANLVADAVAEFMPSTSPGVSYFAPSGMAGYVQGGMAANGVFTGVNPLMVAPMTAGLDPYKPAF